MPTFSAPQITEINEIISRIEKAMTPKAEIGPYDTKASSCFVP